MKQIKKALLWLFLLNKRLFCMPTFLVILAMIPLLVLGYCAASQEESGVVTIALAQEGNDALASQVMNDLVGSTPLIAFRICESPDKAEEQVRLGKADSAWIFPDQLEARVDAFVNEPTSKNAIVRVLERESDVLLMLTREKLSGLLYSLCSPTLYRNFIRENLPELAGAPDEALMDYYNNTGIVEELFLFEQTEGPAAQSQSYLLSPIRGLLAVVILLCGIAAAMYYIQDAQKGIFAWVPQTKLPLAELAWQLVPVVNVSAVSLIALAAIGLAGPLLVELPVLLLYSLCVSTGCMLLRRLCGSIKVLAVLLPLLVVAVLVVCPVFFDLGAVRILQFLLPPTYYIHGAHSIRYCLHMLAYSAAMAALYLLAGKLPRTK